MGDKLKKKIFQVLLLLVIDVKEGHFLTLACNNIMNFWDTCSLKKGAGYTELLVT